MPRRGHHHHRTVTVRVVRLPLPYARIPCIGLQVNALPLVRQVSYTVFLSGSELSLRHQNARGFFDQTKPIRVVAVQVAHEHKVKVVWADSALFKLFMNSLASRQVCFIHGVLVTQILHLAPAGAVIGVPAGINERQPVLVFNQVATDRNVHQGALRPQQVGPCQWRVSVAVVRQRLIDEHGTGMQNS